MTMARLEIGTTRSVVVKSPNSSLCARVALLDFVRVLVFRFSSVTSVSHFPLGCFLPVVAAALSALEQGFDCADERLPAACAVH